MEGYTAEIIKFVRFKNADWPNVISVRRDADGLTIEFEKVVGARCANKSCGRRHLFALAGDRRHAICSSCQAVNVFDDNNKTALDADYSGGLVQPFGQAIYDCISDYINRTLRKGTIADKETGMKKCARCGEFKHVAEFGKDAKRIDGVTCFCIACKPKYERKTRKKQKSERSVGVGSKEFYIEQPKNGVPGVVFMRGRVKNPWKAEFTVGGKKTYFGCRESKHAAGMLVVREVKERTGIDMLEHWTPKRDDDKRDMAEVVALAVNAGFITTARREEIFERVGISNV